ncbi:unnamed protein product [Symbiodinium natans]|uniref:Uncharacterized protein n=1 Tax=Symbiodinium natans TaxID=878477 RepID=A0A812S1C2_9DINO|nr:unnamed protein product [Symbiodinium natans]
MDLRDATHAHRGFSRLQSLLRQWEAADKVATHKLQELIDSMTRQDYLSSEHVGLLGVAALNFQALLSARAALDQRSCQAQASLRLLQAELKNIADAVNALSEELQKEVQHPAFVKEAGVMTLSNAGHLAHKAAQMLRSEVDLRRSLLASVPALRRTDADEERRRLLLVWMERPYSSNEEAGGPLYSLTEAVARALSQETKGALSSPVVLPPKLPLSSVVAGSPGCASM